MWRRNHLSFASYEVWLEHTTWCFPGTRLVELVTTCKDHLGARCFCGGSTAVNSSLQSRDGIAKRLVILVIFHGNVVKPERCLSDP